MKPAETRVGVDELRAARDQVFGVSRSLCVVVTANAGVAVPGYNNTYPIPLGDNGVLLIETLATGDGRPIGELIEDLAARVSVDEHALWVIAADLADRGLIAEGLPVAGNQAPEDRSAIPGQGVEWWVKSVMPSPVIFPVSGGSFEHLNHDGEVRARLTAVEMLAAAEWRNPSTVRDALASHQEALGDSALSEEDFRKLFRFLLATGVIDVFDVDNIVHNPQARSAEEMRDAILHEARIAAAVDERVRVHFLERQVGSDQVSVIPVNTDWHSPPGALGLIVAFARAHQDGLLDDAYSFVPSWYTNDDLLDRLAVEPGIYLFSNYIWQHHENIERSARVKQLNPLSITVHGGPDTPKYAHDLEGYFRDNPHVDITVRGEGEATFAHMLEALRGHVGHGPPVLSVLADVPGLSFRDGDRIVTTGDRDRVADLDTIPSPLLLGMFDDFAAGPADWVTLETNRGCPYGCTFCDWGSATLSRVRKFDIERVFAELEWCAQHRIEGVGIADANFGIFERDVEIAEKITQLKAQYTYPHSVGNNYAKNTVKHLSKIIEMFAAAGIVVEGAVSLQSMDDTTLVAIKRKNIKVEQYNNLSTEFRKNSLPLTVELMMGLPGATMQSFRDDLQECADRGVRARVNPTYLLPNSPMNDPAYRAEHGITASSGELVKQTSSYTTADYEDMEGLREAFLLCDRFGVLRQLATFVRRETGVREIELYERMLVLAKEDPERWPVIAFSFRALEAIMAPPGSWKRLLDEARRYVVEELGVPDDSALDTVMAVQLALIPARDRTFPDILAIEHDYAAWYSSVTEAKETGLRHDWHDHVPHLREFPPATFAVDDPDGLCTIAVGLPTYQLSLGMLGWDLDSPVARAWLARGAAAVV